MNLMFLAPGTVGGSEPLLTNLAAAIGRTDNDLFVFAVKGFSNSYPEIATNAEVIEVPWSRNTQAVRIAAENTWLAKKARDLKLDIMHHGVGTTPYIKSVPTVTTIHDIQYVMYPSNFTRAKLTWLKVNVPYTARSSKAITPPSNFVKEELIKTYSIPSSKIVVVPFGSENLLGPMTSDSNQVRSRYHLDGPFFLYPARSYPHKNHLFLIEAFKPIAGKATLIMTGPSWFRDSMIKDKIKKMGLEGSVRHLGAIPREDLSALYGEAVALTYPTRFEGFGAPVLEAMSRHCPVISSNVTALPEVVADAGILLDPDDMASWAQSMESFLVDPNLRSTFVQKGDSRLQEFTWKKSAALQIEAYEMAAAR